MDERELKQRIIDASFELFSTKGYDKTRISDIIKSAECSKGGFYHHFSSKQEVLDDMLYAYIAQLRDDFYLMFEKENDVFRLLSGVISEINGLKAKHMANWPSLMKVLAFSENEIVIRKMAGEFNLLAVEIYEKIFGMGNEKGEFKVNHTHHLAGLWTREIMRLYEETSRLILNWSDEAERAYMELLSFSEDMLQSTLHDAKGRVEIKEAMREYTYKARERYMEITGKN